MTDLQLIQRIKSGDQRAEKELYSRYWRSVGLNLVRGNRGTLQDAQDNYQDSMLILFQRLRLGRYDDLANAENSLKPVIVNIARIQWLVKLRQRRNRPTDLLDADDLERLSSEIGADEMEAILRIIEQGADAKFDELLKRIDKEKNIGAKCQRIARLFYYDRLSHRAIGEILDQDPNEKNTNKNGEPIDREKQSRDRLSRCLARIRALLAELSKQGMELTNEEWDELIRRYLDGEADPNERERIEDRLREEPEFRQQMDLHRRVRAHFIAEGQAEQRARLQAYHQEIASPFDRVLIVNWQTWTSMAAVLAGLVVGGWWLWHQTNETPIAEKTQTPGTRTDSIQLTHDYYSSRPNTDSTHSVEVGPLVRVPVMISPSLGFSEKANQPDSIVVQFREPGRYRLQYSFRDTLVIYWPYQFVPRQIRLTEEKQGQYRLDMDGKAYTLERGFGIPQPLKALN